MFIVLIFKGNSRGRRTVLDMMEFLKYDMYEKLIVNIELPPFGPSHIFKSYKVKTIMIKIWYSYC